ncbi:hypothetical protein [Paraburkholderia unamae]|uniref:hypothetical protein n=1 Tax=Paraburkholderia unamae TaxID=219649 RepID=UPI000DD48880|nr:hypothetical protein [Paraburkholderia unamae]
MEILVAGGDTQRVRSRYQTDASEAACHFRSARALTRSGVTIESALKSKSAISAQPSANVEDEVRHLVIATIRRLATLGTNHMQLYYLTAEKWAKKSIAERRLKISLFGELNDPFELLPHVLPSREHRQVARVSL